jgi:hypothetical protein
MRPLRALVVLLLLGGIAHADTPAAQEMAAGDVTRWLSFWDKLVTTVVKPQTCDRMAGDVSSLVDHNKDALAVVKAARQQGKKLPEAAQQHMLEGVKKMVPAMQKCGQHDKVRAAFAKLDLNRR